MSERPDLWTLIGLLQEARDLALCLGVNYNTSPRSKDPQREQAVAEAMRRLDEVAGLCGMALRRCNEFPREEP